MWVLFCSKCVKLAPFSNLEEYTWADGYALRYYLELWQGVDPTQLYHLTSPTGEGDVLIYNFYEYIAYCERDEGISCTRHV